MAGVHVALQALPAGEEVVRIARADQGPVQGFACDVLHLLRQPQQQREPAGAHDARHHPLLVLQWHARAIG